MMAKLDVFNDAVRKNKPIIAMITGVIVLFGTFRLLEMHMASTAASALFGKFEEDRAAFEGEMDKRFDKVASQKGAVSQAFEARKKEKTAQPKEEVFVEDSPEKVKAELQKDADYIHNALHDPNLSPSDQMIKAGAYETYPFRSGREQMRRQRESLEKAFKEMHEKVDAALQGQHDYINEEAQRNFGTHK